MICFACGKEETNPDPLLGRWYLYSKEEIATEDGVRKHRIDTLDDRESYIEFTSTGALLTVEGNGKFTRTPDSIYIAIDYSGNGAEVEGKPYRYTLANDMLTFQTSEQHFETHFIDRINYKRLMHE